jgi:hypothetical protein
LVATLGSNAAKSGDPRPFYFPLIWFNFFGIIYLHVSSFPNRELTSAHASVYRFEEPYVISLKKEQMTKVGKKSLGKNIQTAHQNYLYSSQLQYVTGSAGLPVWIFA